MDGQMGRWMDEWVGEWMDGWIGAGWMDQWMSRWMRYMDGQVNGGEWAGRGCTGIQQRAQRLRGGESCLYPVSDPKALWVIRLS